MKVGILFSGGKDSNFALYEASKKHEIVCIITLKSENDESYMFQTQGIDFTKFQADALNLPQIEFKTKGIKEKELMELKNAILFAKEKYNIEGIVTGAINSIYQASRVQKICDELVLWCFNPLWQKDQISFLYELLENNFKVMIVGVASYPLDKSYLGKIIDKNLILKLTVFRDKYKINPAGEGGELETFVLDSPCFKKELIIKDFEVEYDGNYCGKVIFNKLELKEK